MGSKTMNVAALMALTVIFVAIQVSSHRQEEEMMHQVISDALSSKGYAAMSLVLEDTLLKHIMPLISSSSSHQYFTIFVPQDKAFFTLKYGQHPIALFKYQIAPLKISDNNYYSSLCKIEFLIPGHPFVLIALPPGASGDRFTSVNDVKITDWNLYTNQHIAIHGVEDFFDPPPTLTSNPLTSVI